MVNRPGGQRWGYGVPSRSEAWTDALPFCSPSGLNIDNATTRPAVGWRRISRSVLPPGQNADREILSIYMISPYQVLLESIDFHVMYGISAIAEF